MVVVSVDFTDPRVIKLSEGQDRITAYTALFRLVYLHGINPEKES